MFETDYFSNIATQYDSRATFKKNTAIKEYLHKKIGQIRDSLILDIGTGTGNFSEIFSNQNNEIIGLDKNISMLKIAAQKKISPIVADVINIPFKNETFDLCLCRQLFQYLNIPQLKLTLKEIKRILKPSSLIILHHMVPEDSTHSKKLKIFMRVGENNNKYLLHKDIMKISQAEGFEVIDNDVCYFHTEESINQFMEYRGINELELMYRIKKISENNINQVKIDEANLSYRNLYSFISLRSPQ